MTNELVKRPLIKKIRKVYLSNWRLYVLLLPALLWLFVFRYTPMYGLTLAFKDFSIRKGILDSPWDWAQILQAVLLHKHRLDIGKEHVDSQP